METVNSMKKTVLKLENEISAIGLNLTKVQKKEHSKMKSIIQNINKLLNEESNKNNIHLNKVDKYFHNEKNNKKEENNIINKMNKYVHTKNNNIDCILISLKKKKNKNSNGLNINEETFFNNKKKSSSIIYINKNNQNNIISNEKILKINESDYNNYKTNTLTNKQKKKNISKSRNKNNLFYNHMTYSKPKLNNEFSKNNLNKKRRKTNSSNKIINNIFDINYKCETLIPIEGKDDSILELKNSKTTAKFKENEIETISNNLQHFNDINNIFSNSKKRQNEKPFKKELLYDQNIFPLEEFKMNDNQEINDENIHISEKDLFFVKNKKQEFDFRPEVSKTCNYNNNSKASSSLKKYKFMNTCRNGINLVHNKNSKNPILINDDRNGNLIKSFEQINSKINDEDLYSNSIDVSKHKNINKQKKNYSRDAHSKKDAKIEETNIKITKLLNMLKANDINEAVSKVAKLIKLQKYINKLKKLYNEDNNYLNNSRNNLEENKSFQWLYDMINNYRENKIYKNFCESIMVNNKINHFDDFKRFINNILINNRKNNGFIVEVKNILLEDNYCANKKKGKSVNKINNGRNIKIINQINNKTFHELENSNDIKFSRNDENFEMKEDWIKTFY